MRRKFVTSLLAVAIVSTSGCAELGINKEQAGTVLGGLAGVAIGSTIGKGNGQIAAALIAGGIGAYVGNRIGHMLDEKDQQALAVRTQEILSQPTTASAQPVTWKSDHSGATAQITPGKEYTKPQQVEVKRAPTIQAVPSMKLINEPYLTTTDSLNVRSAPNQNGEKVGSLPKNTEFTAVGSTGDWILVGRKGVTVGYVSKKYVEPKATAIAKRAAPVNLDDMDVASSPETKAFDLDSIQSLPSQTVTAEAACRPVTVSLKSASGQAEQEQNTFCKQANGTWELI